MELLHQAETAEIFWYYFMELNYLLIYSFIIYSLLFLHFFTLIYFFFFKKKPHRTFDDVHEKQVKK